MMRKWLCALLTCLLLAGCAGGGTKGEEEALDFSSGDAQGKSRGSMAAVTPSQAPEQDAAAPPQASASELDIPPLKQTGGSGKLTVEETSAYAFQDTLYGGFTYTNAGSGPMLLTEATLTFSYAGREHTEVYEPFMGVNDIVMPGETACATLFAPMEGLTRGESDVELRVSVSGESTQESMRGLDVRDAMLIQNYPGFATLSGRVVNNTQEESRLCMVYVQFYDENQALIGVWYFTRNALLQPGQESAFVVHLQSLPVEGLADKTKTMRFRAFRL